MKKIIIFDFNRTIFDPDSKKLITGTVFLLKKLRKKYDLYLITGNAKLVKNRKKIILGLGIKQYFRKIIICKRKTKREFEKIINQDKNVDKKRSFVIGDQIRREIRIGNRLGLKTIRICSGKFSNELPIKLSEKPDFQVKNINDVGRIVL